MKLAIVAIAAGALASAACLRTTEFRCATDTDCGAGGTCQSVGFCSFPDAQCGQRFGDAAGPYANQCVTGSTPSADGGVDASVDAMVDAAGCSSDFVAISGLTHRYKLLANADMWMVQSSQCTTAGGYLAIPDDTNELQGLDSFVGTAGVYWVGIDDVDVEGQYVTVKAQAAAFLPWATGQPDNAMNSDCVSADPATALYDDEKCNTTHPAVCECEP